MDSKSNGKNLLDYSGSDDGRLNYIKQCVANGASVNYQDMVWYFECMSGV